MGLFKAQKYQSHNIHETEHYQLKGLQVLSLLDYYISNDNLINFATNQNFKYGNWGDLQKLIKYFDQLIKLHIKEMSILYFLQNFKKCASNEIDNSTPVS